MSVTEIVGGGDAATSWAAPLGSATRRPPRAAAAEAATHREAGATTTSSREEEPARSLVTASTAPAPVPAVVGLDLSLTATGLASEGATAILAPPGKMTGILRLRWFRNEVGQRLAGYPLVVVEGYSFGTPNNAHHAGELGGVVLLQLEDMGVPYAIVPPAMLKKFATGVGNAKKDAVLVAALRAGYDGDDNNEADAWWLRQIGLYHLGVPEVPITVYRTETVRKVTWPDLLADGVPVSEQAS